MRKLFLVKRTQVSYAVVAGYGDDIDEAKDEAMERIKSGSVEDCFAEVGDSDRYDFVQEIE